MIRHLLKIIWLQRSMNVWIFIVLLVVICAVWRMADRLYVDLRTYYSPMGYDISNSWYFQLDAFDPDANEYISEEVSLSSSEEDLFRLQEQIKQHPKVENVCIAFYSAPYSFGNSWTGIEPIDGDTTAREQSFQCRYVSPEYFDVFRITDIYGNSITEQLEGRHNPVVVSEDMALKFFNIRDVRDRQIKHPTGEEHMTIATVSNPYRDNEFVRSEPFFYKLITPGFFGESSTKHAEFCVRMKQSMSQEEMNDFLREIGVRLIANNLYVYSANSIAYRRDILTSEKRNQQDRELSLMAFLLINVFFGIIGTFWLRGQSRCAETGLRIALGANKTNIKQFMYTEGLLLLCLTIPFTLAFVLHMLFLDMPDTYRQPYTIGRFLITYCGTYLLLSVLICIGIWFPVRKAEQIAPAEALHYE